MKNNTDINFFCDLNEKVKKLISFLISFEGRLSAISFVMLLLFIKSFIQPLDYLTNSMFLSYIANLCSLYFMLALIQKRCRDFGSSGTYWILAFSIAFIGDMAFSFCNVQEAEDLLRHIYFVMVCIQLIVFICLLLIPSKANVDERIRSPLLKHPLIYTLICIILAIGATIGVNYYNGVNIL